MRFRCLWASLLLISVAGCGAESGERTTSTSESTVVCAGKDLVHGVDVSVYQGTIDWTAVKGDGIDFAIARVGDGLGVDKQFDANWTGMKDAGILRGAYQFFEPADDPNALADLFLEKIGTLGEGDLPPALDVEKTGGQTPQTIAANIHVWMEKVAAATGRTPIIYTGRYFWNDSVGGSTDFGNNPLWLPAWGATCPNTPNGWNAWAFWQTSAKGTVAGIAGDVDLDVFDGTLSDLNGLASPPNALPIGAIDAADCVAGVSGWASDPNALNQPIEVEVHFDSGAKGVVRKVSADEARADLCKSIGSCDHSFSVPIPIALVDGKSHAVTAVALDSSGTKSASLGAPVHFACQPLQLPIFAVLPEEPKALGGGDNGGPPGESSGCSHAPAAPPAEGAAAFVAAALATLAMAARRRGAGHSRDRGAPPAGSKRAQRARVAKNQSTQQRKPKKS
jgi:lysozyme